MGRAGTSTLRLDRLPAVPADEPKFVEQLRSLVRKSEDADAVLAERCGLHIVSLRRWQARKKKLGMNALTKIAAALGGDIVFVPAKK